ncbi:hypothetical protein T01_7125 [Trichinella spiralis]|uniref:Uncharacterized protein n=1 Tax=Trichinella spiralis TaxID=6334 RepID=A0A0V1BFB2_TRISP|nr:hypothetical protein T01_7125 [Trichinella spiralis]
MEGEVMEIAVKGGGWRIAGKYENRRYVKEGKKEGIADKSKEKLWELQNCLRHSLRYSLKANVFLKNSVRRSHEANVFLKLPEAMPGA